MTLATYFLLKERCSAQSSSHPFHYKVHTDEYLKLVRSLLQSIQLLNIAENLISKDQGRVESGRKRKNKSTSYHCQETGRFLSCSQHCSLRCVSEMVLPGKKWVAWNNGIQMCPADVSTNLVDTFKCFFQMGNTSCGITLHKSFVLLSISLSSHL